MAKSWHNSHIPTKVGIAVIAWLLVSVALLIPVLHQQQVGESHAMYQPTAIKKNANCPTYYISWGGTCVGYVMRVSASKWYCSNGSHGRPIYNKYISN